MVASFISFHSLKPRDTRRIGNSVGSSYHPLRVTGILSSFNRSFGCIYAHMVKTLIETDERSLNCIKIHRGGTRNLNRYCSRMTKIQVQFHASNYIIINVIVMLLPGVNLMIKLCFIKYYTQSIEMAMGKWRACSVNWCLEILECPSYIWMVSVIVL